MGRGEPVGVGGGVRRGGAVGRRAGVTLGEALGGGVKRGGAVGRPAEVE